MVVLVGLTCGVQYGRVISLSSGQLILAREF